MPRRHREGVNSVLDKHRSSSCYPLRDSLRVCYTSYSVQAEGVNCSYRSSVTRHPLSRSLALHGNVVLCRSECYSDLHRLFGQPLEVRRVSRSAAWYLRSLNAEHPPRAPTETVGANVRTTSWEECKPPPKIWTASRLFPARGRLSPSTTLT